MADPRNTINPETGRPIGEDRIDSMDMKLTYEELIDPSEEETSDPETGVVVRERARTGGVMALQNDHNHPDAAKRFVEAFFGKK